MKTKIIPFDLETAKKIQSGEIEGRITTKDGKDVRIVCTDKASTDDDNKTQIVCLIRLGARELVSIHDPNTGTCWDIEDGNAQHLVLEVPDNEPQFKPFDKVLVRNEDTTAWGCAIFSHITNTASFQYAANSLLWKQCIPYEGNEHLVGTTDKPKED
jgi:hypothetical protein